MYVAFDVNQIISLRLGACVGDHPPVRERPDVGCQRAQLADHSSLNTDLTDQAIEQLASTISQARPDVHVAILDKLITQSIALPGVIRTSGKFFLLNTSADEADSLSLQFEETTTHACVGAEWVALETFFASKYKTAILSVLEEHPEYTRYMEYGTVQLRKLVAIGVIDYLVNNQLSQSSPSDHRNTFDVDTDRDNWSSTWISELPGILANCAVNQLMRLDTSNEWMAFSANLGSGQTIDSQSAECVAVLNEIDTFKEQLTECLYIYKDVILVELNLWILRSLHHVTHRTHPGSHTVSLRELIDDLCHFALYDDVVAATHIKESRCADFIIMVHQMLIVAETALPRCTESDCDMFCGILESITDLDISAYKESQSWTLIPSTDSLLKIRIPDTRVYPGFDKAEFDKTLCSFDERDWWNSGMSPAQGDEAEVDGQDDCDDDLTDHEDNSIDCEDTDCIGFLRRIGGQLTR